LSGLQPQNHPLDSTKTPHQFVALIAMFLETYTDQLITRSDKDLLLRDFIVDLCAIADPHIGRSTIDQALKAHVRRRRGKNNP